MRVYLKRWTFIWLLYFACIYTSDCSGDTTQPKAISHWMKHLILSLQSNLNVFALTVYEESSAHGHNLPVLQLMIYSSLNGSPSGNKMAKYSQQNIIIVTPCQPEKLRNIRVRFYNNLLKYETLLLFCGNSLATEPSNLSMELRPCPAEDTRW